MLAGVDGANQFFPTSEYNGLTETEGNILDTDEKLNSHQEILNINVINQHH